MTSMRLVVWKASTLHTSSSSSNSLNMLSMSIKEFWIILQEQETDDVITDVQAERAGGRSHQLFSPVVGSEPVERCVQLDDVGAEQDEISDLRMRAVLAAAENDFQNEWKKKKIDGELPETFLRSQSRHRAGSQPAGPSRWSGSVFGWGRPAMPGSSTLTPENRSRRRRSLKRACTSTWMHKCKSSNISLRAGSCKRRMYQAVTHLVLQDGIFEAADLVALCIVVFYLEENFFFFFQFF